MKPIVAITMGDPRGVGPEVIAKALASESLHPICSPLVLGDFNILEQTVRSLHLALKVAEVQGGGPFDLPPGALAVFPLSWLSPGPSPVDIPVEDSSRASFAYVEKAGRMVLAGQAEAIVTAPVSKEAISRLGIPFRGHTEYFAELSGTRNFVMMLAGERLRVALVTTHLPLNQVSGSLSEEKIFSVIEMTGRGLKDFWGFRAPGSPSPPSTPTPGKAGSSGKKKRSSPGRWTGPGKGTGMLPVPGRRIPSFTARCRVNMTPSSACTTIRA